MTRFSVLYRLDGAYRHQPCSTYCEAQTCLASLSSRANEWPLGIYDAKTELFSWAPALQAQQDRLSIAEQGRWGQAMIDQAQQLREPASGQSNAELQAIALSMSG